MTEGRHIGGYKYRNRRNRTFIGKNHFWEMIITALAGTVIKDLSSSNSKLKKVVNKVIQSKQLESKQKQIINAKYSIIENRDDENNINGEENE